MLTTYNANRLAADGFTGKGITIVIFAFDGYDQADLDTFATTYGLPKFTPILVGGQPEEPRGETTMDLEVAHAVAPDAQKVVVNARPTVEGDGGYEKIGQMLESTDRQFPGAVWSFSIGWGCDKLITAADLAPVRSALAPRTRNGTTAFNASGDLAGLECKGGQDWSSPPGDADIGLDSVASLPEMTDVGGTTLSTDANGVGWPNRPGSTCRCRRAPAAGCRRCSTARDGSARCCRIRTRRAGLTPDVAAVADPFTGVRIVFNQQQLVGGGTSQSAPIWAGPGGGDEPVPDRQRRAPARRSQSPAVSDRRGAMLPGFRDVTLGGNAVDDAGPGYDLVTGLGTPDVDNLVRNLLVLQKATA